jgi:hypothetical protein
MSSTFFGNAGLPDQGKNKIIHIFNAMGFRHSDNLVFVERGQGWQGSQVAGLVLNPLASLTAAFEHDSLRGSVSVRIEK